MFLVQGYSFRGDRGEWLPDGAEIRVKGATLSVRVVTQFGDQEFWLVPTYLYGQGITLAVHRIEDGKLKPAPVP